jgi:SAM-dependent methyltransferase
VIAAADVIETLRRWTPTGLYPFARVVYRRAVAPVECWCVAKADELLQRTYDGRLLPPALLRFKVRGMSSGEQFARIGRQCANDIAQALASVGVRLDECRSILDFGCGCGGTLLWLRDLAPNASICGTDIDAEAIAWSRTHLSFATFTTNGADPPLEFDDARFDVVYAVSVFTHLDEAFQARWLAELRRVLMPGGTAVITLHGAGSWREMPAQDRETLARRGFVFVRNDASRGLFPDWYQMSFHSRAYVESVYAEFFDVIGFIERSMNGHQDIVILRRRPD